MTSREAQALLTSLVMDRGLATTLEDLAHVCLEKADEVHASHPTTAQYWNKQAGVVTMAAHVVHNG